MVFWEVEIFYRVRLRARLVSGARGTTRGSRPVDYDPAKGVTIKPYQSKGGIVGNDPCVVPVWLKILADYNGTLYTCAEIPPANRARSHTI